MNGPPAPHDSPVEAYLDQLLGALSGPPRQIRHQLAEAEDHLRESTAAGVARGLPPQQAELEAVERFGPARSLAQAETRRQRRSLGDIVAGCVISGWWLGALGAVAVGISGALAALTTTVWGQTFTAGRPPASVLTATNCARWIANTHAATCTEAAIGDWAHDTVLSRVAFGVLGVLALVAWLVWSRRQAPPRRSSLAPGRGPSLAPGRGPSLAPGGLLDRFWGRLGSGRTPGRLPAAVVDTIALTCFGGAGLWLTGQTIDTLIVASGRGAGQWLSGAPVAAGLAVAFGVRLLHDLRAGDL